MTLKRNMHATAGRWPDDKTRSVIPTREEWSTISVVWLWLSHRGHTAHVQLYSIGLHAAKCSFDPKAIAEHRPDERSLSAIPTGKEWSAIFVGWSWQSHRIHMASMAKRDRFLKRMVVKAEVRKLPEFFFEEGEGSVFSAEIQNP
ncbi:hypothetical protein GGX14DRAFT_399115 [Mycena pura]|uniref:Uncharacterized protein n=1 Tax=Mycena pura TaxID=153505 RepID=A0AAD6Y5Z0_9AGAR|nr:hypothetical protein GGX14DRAFT_399115 [Mycena pura]